VSLAAAPLVFKFGGSAFLDLDAYATVAGYLALRLAGSQRRAVVVVSAMSGTTGRLQEALLEVNKKPPAAAARMILPAGEYLSAGLLIAALDGVGITAGGMLGNQIGLLSEGRGDRATLLAAEPGPVRDLLQRVRVAVLPGGQAADKNGGLTMLGRNSSDLSAVALAGALGSTECELFSDVAGVCSADPYLVPAARVLAEVDYATMCLLSSAGAKVIHEQAVRWAQRHHIKIRCRSLPPEAACATTVAAGPPFAAVALHERGDVWTFPDPESRRRAMLALTEEGLDCLPVEIDGWQLVANAYGLRATANACCAEGTLRDDVALLTVARADGTVTRRLVPRTEGADHTRQQHKLLYPEVAAATDERAGLTKLRSEQSGLLFGDAGALRYVDGTAR
jgi:aspartate kinase